MLRKILFFLLFFQFWIGLCQNNPLSDYARVSVITVGVADQVYELYGHTAIRIKDSKLNIDLVYNYGMFDFGTENFMLKFSKGDLQYFAAAYPYSDFEYSYKVDNRSIYEQVLNISASEKQKLFDNLNKSLFSKDKYYTYKFIDQNCTTKVVDVLNASLLNNPIKKLNITTATYREILNPYVENHFFYELGINLIFGKKVDAQATTMFLPLDLYENLKKISYQKKPLVSETITVFDAKRPVIKSYLANIYLLGFILLLVVLINNKKLNIVYFSLLGIVGLLFLLMSVYSLHRELYWNYNILLLNPLFLILVYFMVKKNTFWIKRLSYAILFSLIIYTLYMTTKIHFWIVVPFTASIIILLFRNFLVKKTA